MTPTVKALVAASFGEAASTYDDHAWLQREIALDLAGRIGMAALSAHPSVLEIGCGTGFLSSALLERLGPAKWVFTDLSEAMIRYCRRNLGQNLLGESGDANFLAMDGEAPAFAPATFDLVCSSLAFQWFSDLPTSLAGLMGLLAPGGELHFASLAAGSFAEWRQAHLEAGLLPGIPDYPSLDAFRAMFPPEGTVTLEEACIQHGYASGLDFMAELKGIGAHRSPLARPPLPAGALRRLLRRFEPPEGLRITYRIAYGRFRRG